MRGIGTLTTLAYFALAAWVLLCWMPGFFDLNGTSGTPRIGFRYVAATGIPVALLLLAAAWRQARLPGFSILLLGQVVAAAVLLGIALGEFWVLKPATILCVLHILLCAVFIAWMMFGWRGKTAAA